MLNAHESQQINRFIHLLNYSPCHIFRNRINQLQSINGNASPCVQFAIGLIEYATNKRMMQRNNVILSTTNQGNNVIIPFPMNYLLNYNSFLACPAGSLLCVINNFRARHYVVKYGQNRVIGLNHGGFMLNRSNNRSIVQIVQNDFNGNNFLYDVNNAPANQLVNILFNLT